VLVTFNNFPVLVDEDGGIESSAVDWVYCLSETRHRSAGTVKAYLQAVALVFEFVSRFSYWDTDVRHLEKILTEFKRALLNGDPRLGWEPHSASYVSQVLTAINLYLDYVDLREVSCSHQGLGRFVQMAKKKRSFLGHIKPGKAALLTRSQRQRNVRVGTLPGPLPVRYFPPDRLFDLIELAPSHRDKALYLGMAGTSARIGQILNLCQRDIVFDERRVVFVDPNKNEHRRQWLWEHYRLRPDPTIQNKGPLPGVFLPPLREAFFDQAMLYREREFIPESNRSCPHPYFFVTRSGQRLSKRQINEQFRRLTGKLGLDGLTPHSLRHLYGYFSAVVLKMDMAIIQHCMGHRDLASTQVYTQIPSGDAERAFQQALERLMNPCDPLTDRQQQALALVDATIRHE
jgi:integrase